MSRDMVWRLLRRNISVWQTAGYALANFVGLSIVLCALKFYCDVRSGEQGEDPYVTRDYIVISKKVSGIGGLLGADKRLLPGRDFGNSRAAVVAACGRVYIRRFQCQRVA